MLALALGLSAQAVTLGQTPQQRAVLAVKNPTALSRPAEIIEIPLAEIAAKIGPEAPERLTAEDLGSHKPLPVQVDGASLLVLVSLAPRQTLRIEIRQSANPPAVSPLVFGRAVPERKDDFAWENDKVAHRVYGPALQATGEVTSGIDVWSKRVPDLVVNSWYLREAEGQRTHNPALSYHKDTGQGMDSYDVGKTRGCGGTALWKDGKLYVSRNYLTAEILAAGPIRLRFRLRYAPWDADGAEATEEKTVTLDAGAHFNRIESAVRLSNASTARWAAGLAIHAGARVTSAPDGGSISVWEPLSDPATGMDGTAIVLPPGKSGTKAEAEGNVLLTMPLTSGAPVVYYAGSAWSRAEVPDEAAWSRFIEQFRERLRHPLTTRWERIE